MKTNCDDCCYPQVVNPQACGCCEGIEIITPLSTYNRPGLSEIIYRIGSHGGFMETMTARLTGYYLEKQDEEGNLQKVYPLKGLTTRDTEDPSLAMLDAWATVADVLTFYQERIANEGYLRTATERRSVLELARLVGYRPRPGVASSVFLAYTLDENFKEETVIPAGSRSQSIPGPDELPQSFETSEDLKARTQWNNLTPRIERPQNITLASSIRISNIYLSDSTAKMQENDPLLLVFGDGLGDKIVRIVTEINSDFNNNKIAAGLLEIPFLITLAIDLLRAVIFQLNEKLENSDGEAELIKSLHNNLQTILENFSLGNYPPLETNYFSQERIYRFLCSLRRNFTGFGEFVSENSDIAEVFPTILDSALDELLQDKIIQQELICLSRDVLEQLEPEDAGEKECLNDFLSSIINAIEKNHSLTPFLFLFEGFAMLLQDSVLREELTAFLTKHLSETSLNQFLNWLKQVPINKDSAKCGSVEPQVTNLNLLAKSLLVSPSTQPRNSTRLQRKSIRMFGNNSDTLSQTLISFKPQLSTILNSSWSNAHVDTKSSQLKSVHALSLSAPLFGYNAPVKMGLKKNTDSNVPDIEYISVPDGDWSPSEFGDEMPDLLYLDNAYKEIQNGSNIVIRDNHNNTYLAARAEQVISRPRSAYNISGKTTQMNLSRNWWRSESLSMSSIRKTEVWVETAELSLGLEPVKEDVSDDFVELDRVYGDLDSGRWLIVTGDRSDIPGTRGIQFSELVMLSNVEHIYDENLSGDKPHTKIQLAEKLKYSFKRDTVSIHGNVVKATHGETRHEVLGSGNGAQPFQSFELKQFPLTHVSASNPTGVDSTLKMFVNDLQWHEADSLAALEANDRQFISKTDNEDKTTVISGNGKKGARLPTGIENIRAEYRNGIGKPGNVNAEQISLLMTKPLGVKEVINPLRASGGANRETRDQARKHVPLAVKALDRLVSVQDYEDFSRVYAGIGKAHAVELSNGRQQLVHVTIAGAEDIPIDQNSDLFRNLRRALHDFGDPHQAIQLAIRELKFIVIEAGVAILPDYQWEPVVTDLRERLLEAFSFERRELGQDVMLSEAIHVMQAVRGVAYVDVDSFGGIPEKKSATEDEIEDFGENRRLLTPDEIADEVAKIVLRIDQNGDSDEQNENLVPQRLTVNLAAFENKTIRPAQLAFLTADVPATLILNQIETLP